VHLTCFNFVPLLHWP